MQIGEAKISALVVSALTGIGLTLFMNQALRDLGLALSISIPVTLVMGAVLFVLSLISAGAGDRWHGARTVGTHSAGRVLRPRQAITKDGDKPPKGK